MGINFAILYISEKRENNYQKGETIIGLLHCNTIINNTIIIITILFTIFISLMVIYTHVLK